GLEAAQTERQLRENEQHQQQEAEAATGRHRRGGEIPLPSRDPRPPFIYLARMVVVVEETGADHNENWRQIDTDDYKPPANHLPEAAHERRAQEYEEQGGHNQALMEDRCLIVGAQRPMGVLDEVDRGVSGRERLGNDEVGSREAEQRQDEDLPHPTRHELG